MQHAHHMKGRPRLLMTLRGAQGTLELVDYVDGSYGIVRNGSMIGIWEADEEGECARTFAKHGQFANGLPEIIFTRLNVETPSQN